MILYHDPICADYGSSLRPEQPARTQRTAQFLNRAHPEWEWRRPPIAEVESLRLAHTDALLERLQHPPDLDEDTPYFENILDHARRSVGSAFAASDCARLEKRPAFSLMRPPGHHATGPQAMGFCYLNQIALAALRLRQLGVERVAVWDFDAHHGNGTEAILHGKPGVLFISIHQLPGYPGTGAKSFDNCLNYPVAPHTPREKHLAVLRESWDALLAFKPEMVLISAGFDAYVHDPITEMTLEKQDFATLGQWVGECGLPAAGILEGGYSPDLPELVDSFLTAWSEQVE